MSDEPRNTPLEGLLETFGEAMRRGLFTSEPGKITRYDANARRASVQLSIPRSHVDRNDDRVVELVPELTSVPVVFMGPARGAITWPVRAGDDCLVWFASSSTKRWRRTARAGVDPGDDATHDINAAFCMVCDFFSTIDAPADKTVINGPTRVGGATGTEKTIMADTFVSKLGDVVTEIVSALNGIAPLSGATVAVKWTALLAAAIKSANTEVK